MRFLRLAVSIPPIEKVRSTNACEASSDIRSRATRVLKEWIKNTALDPQLSASSTSAVLQRIYCQKVTKTGSVINNYSVFTSIT